ncbi:MAG: iron hydrogenase small subunit [Clostridiales bacterium]|nr:iron hydrogenase small subunit [Clostridiales bacterium]
MRNIKLTIDNQVVVVPEGTTILEAAKKVNIKIPTLCHHPDQKIKANCRICLVETGDDNLDTACSTFVREGMKVNTKSKLVRETQLGVLELILANHDQDCLKCVRNGHCELQDLCEKFSISRDDIEIIPPHDIVIDSKAMDLLNPAIVRDYSKCIKCNRCVEVCREVQDASILAGAFRSTDYTVQPAYGKTLSQTLCTYCGQCAVVCPVGAIYEKSEIQQVWDAIDNPNLHVVVQVAPAVRISIGEEFGFKPGTAVTGKTVSALRRLGFDQVFDTNFTADLTIIEEGYELIDRISNHKTLPMITSCSPGWINYMEGFFPEVIDHVSTCKSPQQMFGTLSKTYYSKTRGIHPSKIYSVSIMPCTAKKFEAKRDEMMTNGIPDVDAVLTTRELAKLIKTAGIDFANLKDEEFDNPFGITTGAAAIFGATGGVMEAALRTVYEVLTDKELPEINFYDVRGMEGIKESSVKIGDLEVKIAVAHGLSNARKLMEQVKDGKSPYHFIEIMSCLGGCIGGGGQPICTEKCIKDQRISGIYYMDQNMPIRKSHENPYIQKLYEDFLVEPNSHVAHELLHTHYSARHL